MDLRTNLAERFFLVNDRYSKAVGLTLDQLNKVLLDGDFDLEKLKAELLEVRKKASAAASQTNASPMCCMFDNLLLYLCAHSLLFGSENVSELLEPTLAFAFESEMDEKDMNYIATPPVEEVARHGYAVLGVAVHIVDNILTLRESRDLKDAVEDVAFLANALATMQETSVESVVESALAAHASFVEAEKAISSPFLDDFIKSSVEAL